MSPVRNQPSGVIASAVASGRLWYPFINCGVRNHNSPCSPVGTSSRVSGSTTRTSALGTRVPALVNRSGWSSARCASGSSWLITPHTSVRP